MGKKKKSPAKRLWITLFVVLVLMIITIISGLLFGYSVFGHGQWYEVFDQETWQHLFSFFH